MFKPTGLFAQTACPEGERCVLPFCIFNHDSKSISASVVPNKEAVPTKQAEEDIENERALKKRRIDQARPGMVSRTPSLTSISSIPKSQPVGSVVLTKSTPTSTTRTVSPPVRKVSLQPHQSLPPKPPIPLDLKPKAASKPVLKPQPSTKTPAIEQLVPRKLGNPPAPFPTRVQLVKLLYAEYIRLTKMVSESPDPDKNALNLSKPEMISLVLDEEEQIAKDNPIVYSNIVKLRIKRLRDIKTIEPWKEERKKHIAKANPELVRVEEPADKRVKTGLTPKQELALLPQLLTPIDDLGVHGYIPKPPTEAEIEEARQGVETAKNWEFCDRCESRFQVFPSRRESDGVLTTNGPCEYHWGRQRRGLKQTTSTWTCCGAESGSAPCTNADSHVFKISDPKRLALLMQFEGTTRPGPDVPDKAVAFDCEMGYTSYGLELIRLTATSWPGGEELVDVLVKPLGEIVDLNSRFSGIWPEDWLNAVAYDEKKIDAKTQSDGHGDEPPSKKRKMDDGSAVDSDEKKQPLKMVSSPQRARELLLFHLTTTTPLIGHAIDNDLNSARICHPAIVDTVLLFPAARPLPIRMGLKALAKKHLDLDIQMGGERGHDSKEDSRATGELVRFKVSQKWKELKLRGWKMEGDEMLSPEQQ